MNLDITDHSAVCDRLTMMERCARTARERLVEARLKHEASKKIAVPGPDGKVRDLSGESKIARNLGASELLGALAESIRLMEVVKVNYEELRKLA